MTAVTLTAAVVGDWRIALVGLLVALLWWYRTAVIFRGNW